MVSAIAETHNKATRLSNKASEVYRFIIIILENTYY